MWKTNSRGQEAMESVQKVLKKSKQMAPRLDFMREKQ